MESRGGASEEELQDAERWRPAFRGAELPDIQVAPLPAMPGAMGLGPTPGRLPSGGAAFDTPASDAPKCPPPLRLAGSTGNGASQRGHLCGVFQRFYAIERGGGVSCAPRV